MSSRTSAANCDAPQYALGPRDRTSFAPETVRPKDNKRHQKKNESAAKSTKLIDLPALITVWAQLRVPSDDNEINGGDRDSFGPRWTFAPNTRVEGSTGKLLSFTFAVASNRTMSS